MSDYELVVPRLGAAPDAGDAVNVSGWTFDAGVGGGGLRGTGRVILGLPWNRITPLEALAYHVDTEIVVRAPMSGAVLVALHVTAKEGRTKYVALFRLPHGSSTDWAQGAPFPQVGDVGPGVERIIVDMSQS